MQIDRVIILSLARRSERRQDVLAAWSETHFDAPVSVHEAVDGLRVAALPERWVYYGRGAYGCYLSHVTALMAAEGTTLVLEDDAVFDPLFGPTLHGLREPAQWDQIFLGGEHQDPDPNRAAGLYMVRDIRRTHGYIVRDPQETAEHLMLQADQGRQIDHALYHPQWRRFVLLPHLVGQAGGTPSDVEPGAQRHADTWWDHRDRQER